MAYIVTFRAGNGDVCGETVDTNDEANVLVRDLLAGAARLVTVRNTSTGRVTDVTRNGYRAR